MRRNGYSDCGWAVSESLGGRSVAVQWGLVVYMMSCARKGGLRPFSNEGIVIVPTPQWLKWGNFALLILEIIKKWSSLKLHKSAARTRNIFLFAYRWSEIGYRSAGILFQPKVNKAGLSINNSYIPESEACLWLWSLTRTVCCSVQLFHAKHLIIGNMTRIYLSISRWDKIYHYQGRPHD